jgi:hypothetical protein
LPVELVHAVAQYLALEDFASFRLTCSLIALSTRNLLAREDFVGLLWRPDAERLYELSRIPECARRVRAVTFNFARLNEYKAFHDSFSHHYIIEPELRSEMLRDKWENYLRTQRQRKTVGEFRLDLVKAALRCLPCLEELTLTWTRCPWERGSEAWRLFSADVSIRMAKGEVFNIQDAILRELHDANLTLHTLRLEPIPLRGPNGEMHPGSEAARASNQAIVNRLPSFELLSGLRRLSLVLDRKSESCMEAGLEAVLCQATSLRELRLEYLPWVRAHAHTAFLQRIHLPNLQALEIDGPEVRLKDLASFLVRHRRTLKGLGLAGVTGLSGAGTSDSGIEAEKSSDTADSNLEDVGCETESGWTNMDTWVEFFAVIRSRLAMLEKVRITGTFTDPASGGGCWFYHDAIDIGSTVPDGACLMPAEPLERYLLGEAEMPELKFWTEEA